MADTLSLDANLEFVFQARVNFANRLKFAPERNGVQRGYTGTSGGWVKGPRLNGKVVPFSGGDWPHFMPDGVVHFEAIYVLEADDGTQILINNRGCRHASPEVLAKMNAFEAVDPTSYYFRVTPKFDVPTGPHEWLGRTVIVGGADRHKDHSIFTYYAMV
jgi:hypothetical protein